MRRETFGGWSSLSYVHTNQSMMYSNTGVLGSVTGVGSDRQLVLYYWLIPNRNTKDGIIINIGWVGGSCV